MKRLVLLVLISLLVLSVNAQEKVANVNFSDKECENLDRGEIVKKEKLGNEIPVKLLPFIEFATPITISSYKKGIDDNVEKIGEKTSLSNPKKDDFLTFFWIFIPFISVFALAYLSTKNKDKGRKKFILFSIILLFAIVISALLGNFFGIAIGFFIGIFAGGFAGAIFVKLTGVILGMISGAITGGFTGLFTREITDPAILWQYVILYFGVCVLAFLFREVIAKRYKKLAS